MTKTYDETQVRPPRFTRPPVVAQPTLFDPPADDDLFPEEQPDRPTARLTATPCRVCSVGRVATLAPARLCAACLGNLSATRAHVEGVLVSAMAHVERAADAWQQAICATDDTVQARWRKAEQLLESGRAKTTPGFAATWIKETEAQTPLGLILLAYETYQTALGALGEQRAWAEGAAREIEQASHDR